MKFLVIFGSIFLLVLGFLLSAIGWQNEVIASEQGVLAQYRDNQNQYDSFWKKVKETAQVPDKYKNDFKDILVSETTSKYGPEGSKATFQWFQDRNIVLSEQMYMKVQNIIESGRNDFKRGQSELVDKQRVLSTNLKQFPGRMVASFFDLPNDVKGAYAPKQDLDGDGKLTVLDYPIVTSGKTQEVFGSGLENSEVDVFR